MALDDIETFQKSIIVWNLDIDLENLVFEPNSV